VLERLAGGHAAEGAGAERHARHVADHDRDGGIAPDVQGGVEGVVDAEDPVAALLHAHGELAEADRAVEEARAVREALDLPYDHA
jgi:hypothetical protein